MKNYNMGLDVGSTTVKVVLLDENENIVYSEYRRHFSDIRSTIIGLIQEAYEKVDGDDRDRELSIATGFLAYPYIQKMASRIEEKYSNTQIHVYPIRNDFFGELITVSGLITGQDLIHQLQNQKLGDRLLLPCNMFRSQEEVFLDDITLAQVEDALQVRADIVKSSGQDFIDVIVNEILE